MTKKIIAIGVSADKKFYKYRLYNSPRSINSFERFAKTLNIQYVNYYDKETRAFIKRVKIQSE